MEPVEGTSPEKPDIAGIEVVIHSILFQDERTIQTTTQEYFYIDRKNLEMGIKLANGGRVFITLDGIVEFLKKELP